MNDEYVMVPQKPTSEMVSAAHEADDEAYRDGALHGATAAEIYAAMLAASPASPPMPQETAAYCDHCGALKPATFRACKESRTGRLFEDLCCDTCNSIIATLSGHLHQSEVPVQPLQPQVAQEPPCPKCEQTDKGQAGEYACSACGLPTLHDDPPAAQEPPQPNAQMHHLTSPVPSEGAKTALVSLRGFARDVLRGFPEDLGCDGFDLQEYATKHGLLSLKNPRPTAPCGEQCQCAEYYDADSMAVGVDCYEMTPLLLGAACEAVSDAVPSNEKAVGSPPAAISDEQIARAFHEAYERLAPEYGYTTRPETREFKADSANGYLMVAVVQSVRALLSAPLQVDQGMAKDAARYRWLRLRVYKDGSDLCCQGPFGSYDKFGGGFLPDSLDVAIDSCISTSGAAPGVRELPKASDETRNEGGQHG